VNLANKKFNYDKFLSHSISKNKFKYTWSLNLSGSNELKHEDLESILKQSQNLNSLSISECKKLKSDSLKLIADYCSNLENLNISSFSVRFLIVRNYVLIMLLHI
jgi:histidyl-tRNA synthetase